MKIVLNERATVAPTLELRPTRRLLLASASISAIIIATGILSQPQPAHAVCSDNMPTSGETVTCNSLPPNPDPVGIIGPTSDGVTVDVNTGGVTNSAGPAIELRSGNTVNIDGFVSAGSDEAIIFNTPTAPSTVSDDINQITAAATTRKAQIADAAADLVLDATSDNLTPQPLPAPVIDAGGGSTDSNRVVINGPAVPNTSGTLTGTVFSQTASSTQVDVDGGLFETGTADAPAFLVGAGGAAELFVHNNGLARTTGDGSALFSSTGTGSAVGVRVDGGSQLRTEGDNSAAISVNADGSVFLFESTDGSAVTPIVETTGTGSAGISLIGTGASTAIVTIAGPNGIFKTAGDDSPLFQFNVGSNSSLSAAIQQSALSTSGANASVLDFTAGPNSDGVVLLQDLLVQSTGANSDALRHDVGTNSSVGNTLITNSSFSTQGDGSRGLFVRGAADMSTVRMFLDTVAVATQGDNAPAFSTVEDDDVPGNNSVQTIDVFDSSFTTTGNNSPGFRSRHLAGISAETTNFDGVTFTTQGNNSAAFLVEGFSGSDTANSISFASGTISTVGANSPGISVGGGYGDSSAQSSEWQNIDITTTAAQSGGFEIKSIGTDGSSTAHSLDNIDILTQGDGSFGFSVGAVDPVSIVPGLVANTNSSFSFSMGNFNIETQGDNAPGYFVMGFQPGATLSDQSVLIVDTSVTTSGENSDGFTLGEYLGRSVTADNFTGALVLDTISSVTTGDNSDAFVISRFTNLTDDNTRIDELAPDGSVIDGFIDTFDGFSATGMNSRAVQNNGIIDGGADGIVLGDGIQGNFANSGTITAQGPNALVYDIDDPIADIFELQPGGVVEGDVLAGPGDDTFILGGEGTASFDVALLDANGTTDSGEQYLDFDIFEKKDGSNWTLTGTNTEIDNFTVAEGLLTVNGILSNGAFTINGGSLGGVGTIGSFVANTGGTVAPGNSIGTLNVAGDAVFNDGSIYQVELDDQGSSDLIDAAGMATINGGTIAVMATPGSFANPVFTFVDNVGFDGQIYTIIEADGGVTGTFSAITDNVPDVDFEGIYSPTMVQIGLTGGVTESEKWIHPSSLSAGASASRLFGETLRRRGRHVASDNAVGARTDQTQSLGYFPRSQTAGQSHNDHAAGILDSLFTATPNPLGWAVWGAGLGATNTIDTVGDVPGWNSSLGGLAFGIERELDLYATPAFIGVAFGYTRASVNSGASDAAIDSYQFGLYAASSFGALNWSSALTYASQDYDFNRPITFGGSTVTALGSANGYAVTGALEVFYDAVSQFGDRDFNFGPLLTLDASYAGRDGFTETGAGVLNLTVASADTSQAIAGLGVAASKTLSAGAMEVTLDGKIAWEHILGDLSTTSSSSIPLAAATFLTESAPANRDRLAVGVGAAFDMSDRISAQARYDGSYSGSNISHRGSAGLTVKF